MIRIPAKVLIVDDEKDFVEMFSLRLTESGEKVFTAHSGQECLEKLAQENIDVVVLDIKMPGMDGVETLKEIKKGQTTSHLKIDVGGHIVTASITNEAVDDLQLKVGDSVWAIIKASDVMVAK